MVDILYTDLINQVYYAIETLRDDPSVNDVRAGCDCGCGGDTFDFEAYDEAAKEAIEVLQNFGITVVGYD